MADDGVTLQFCNVPPVKLVVGESKGLFYVHKDILCDISPFFKAALDGGFKESEEQLLSFPEDDVDTFERFVQWVYTKTFKLKSSFATEAETNAHYLALARLFILADKLQIPTLKDTAILLIFETSLEAKWVPNLDVMAYVYVNSHNNCGLRRFLVDCYVWLVERSWFDRDEALDDMLHTAEFTAELAIGLARRISDPKSLNPFRFCADKAVEVTRYYDNERSENTKDHVVDG